MLERFHRYLDSIFFMVLFAIFQVLHHTLSLVAIAYTMLSGEGQFYTYVVLISEITTPEINMRW
jgi:hypothetical protein